MIAEDTDESGKMKLHRVSGDCFEAALKTKLLLRGVDIEGLGMSELCEAAGLTYEEFKSPVWRATCGWFGYTTDPTTPRGFVVGS